MNYKKIFLIILCLLIISGCATFTVWTQLKAGEYKDGLRNFSVVIPEGWMRFNQANGLLLTKDGIALENIFIERIKTDKKLEYTKKTFKDNMLSWEIAEVEVDNLYSNSEINNFQLITNEPVKIDEIDGFCITYSFRTKSHLRIEGVHYGFLHEQWIYRIRYEAAKQHYFDKYISDFKTLVKTFHLLSK